MVNFSVFSSIVVTSIDIGADSLVIIDTNAIVNYNGCLALNSGSIDYSNAVSGGASPYTYTWSVDSTASGSILANLRPGIYTLTISDQLGCSVVASDTIAANDTCCVGDALVDSINASYAFTPPTTLADIQALNIPSGTTIVLDGNINTATPGTSATVTLTDLTILMTAGSEIAIDTDQTLKLIRTTITACKDMWEGIIVKGNSSQRQMISGGTSNQGYLIMNYSTLEHAHQAVRLYNAHLAYSWFGSGGIIQATNSIFRNNQRSIEFIYYEDWQTGTLSPNPSFFKNCIFESNDAHRTAYPFKEFVKAWAVNTIRFAGCRFLNNHTITTATKDSELGSGITTLHAGILIEDYGIPISQTQNNLVRSEFKNLQYAVSINSYGYSCPSRIEHAKFTNCIKGIRNEGVHLSTFVGNEFLMGGIPFFTFDLEEGILLHQCSGFIVEQNTFTIDSPYNGNVTLGIRSDGTGGADNAIYNNSFNGILVANLANRQNQFDDGISIKTGLIYNCNKNGNNPWRDICVSTEQDNSNGIKAIQGSISKSAGNTFSYSTVYAESDFYNNGVNVTYYYKDNADEPQYYSPRPAVNPDIPFGIRENNCPNNYVLPSDDEPDMGGLSGLTFGGYTDLFNQLKSSYDNYKIKYISLIDGGHRSTLLALVDTATNALRLRDSLLSYAPNLSTPVLNAMVKRSLLADSYKYQILKANAEGVTDSVMFHWVGITAPVPQWMRDSVNAARNNLTYRSYLLDTLITTVEQKQQTAYSILRLIQEDTLGFNIHAYRNWLDSADGVWAKQEIINTYMYAGGYDTIEPQLAQYDSLIIKSDSASFKSYKDFALAFKSLIDADSSIARLDSSQLLSLISLAEVNEHLVGSNMARNALNFFYDSSYFTPALLPALGSGKREKEDELLQTEISWKDTIQENNSVYIRLYPNPARDVVTVAYNGITAGGKVYITNAIGMPIETKILPDGNGKLTLHTAGYTNGIYLVRVEVGGVPILTDKLIILK